MTTIRTRAHIDESRRLTVQLPAEVPVGEHEVTVLVDASRPLAETVPERLFERWPAHRTGVWPEALSLRREDLYGEDGR